MESPAVENLVSAIRSSQNRLAGINRLPEEMLGYIFEALIDLVRGDPDVRLRDYCEDLPQKRWFHVNLVCRYWRHIALSRPALWTCIYFSASGESNKEASGIDLPAVSLGRSCTLPLSGYFQGDPATHAPWKEHAKRFRELHITGTREFVGRSDACPAVWAEEVPSLEILVVNNWPSCFFYDQTDEPPTWRLPRLHTLIWCGHSDGHFGVSRNLRWLVLRDTPVSSPKDLLETLTAIPCLEDLILRNLEFTKPLHAHMLADATWMQTLPRIILPTLKRMDVEEVGPPAFFWLLDRQMVKRDGIARSFSFTASTELIDFPPLSINQDSGYHANYVYMNSTRLIAYDANSTLCIYDQSMCDDVHDVVPDPDALHLRFHWLLKTLGRSQPIRELWLSLQLDDSDIYKSLTFLQDVKRLVIIVDDHRSSWMDKLADDPTLLPCLTYLHLEMVYWIVRPQVESIVKLLIERKKTPCPIRSLYAVKHSDDVDFSLIASALAPHVDLTIETVSSEESREPMHLQMGLPDVFTTPSSVHAYWDGWTGRRPSYNPNYPR